MGKSKLLRDTGLLTASSLVMRAIALLFQMWLVSRVGAAGIGLYGLVGSVGFLAATFAISGIRFASTRLISEEIGYGREGGIGRAMLLCLSYSLLFGLSAALILYLCAEPVGFLWVGDARTVLSLRIVSFSLPFISLSSVFYGYFTANGRIYKAAAVQVAEQLVRVYLVMLFLRYATPGDLEQCCAAVSAGSACAELVSFLLMLTVYLFDRKLRPTMVEKPPRLPSRMLGIAVPLALSAYARTSLSTAEQLLVPKGLKQSGLTADLALAGYGTIQGMVFPIIFFASCIVSALAELVVPELTAAQVSGDKKRIYRLVSVLLKKSILFSLFMGVMLYLLADILGQKVYGSVEAGKYIRIFALLVPIMYTDMMTDGCLKGLGQHVWSMGFNIADALLGVVLVIIVLPRYSLSGYIFIIFFEEIFNFALSTWRLRIVMKNIKAP